MTRLLIAGLMAFALAATGSAAELKSGPQPGEKVPGPFVPLNINGSDAGEKSCLYCKNGNNPVVMIFARCGECPQTAKLITKVDAVTQKNSDCSMGSFVVFCSDEEGLEAQLKDMVKNAQLKKTVLSIDAPTGPSRYNIEKDADITVVLYTNREVKANYAFRKGELKDADIEKIIADVTKIVPEK